MALYDYAGALRLGKRKYQEAVEKGVYPFLPVLDDILASTEIVSEVSLGVIDIPLEKIVGTKTRGRTQAFAGNFMPLLGEKTEFGAKWAYLYDHQIEEGIHDPIVAYEFMNRFYVQEGNKRVSVMKYLKAYSISASVIRLIPRRSDDHQVRLYYEFLDFYQVSFNCDIWFSREGSYEKLLKLMGKTPGEVWSEDDRLYFKSIYDLFSKAFAERRNGDIEMTASDAFLVYVEIFGYEAVKGRSGEQVKRDLGKIWDELLLRSRGGQIALVEQPEEVRGGKGGGSLFNWLVPGSSIEPEMLKVAFLYAHDRESSSWAYAHELGRQALEESYQGKLRTVVFEHVNTEAEITEAISLAVAAQCNVIFTTAPQMAAASVKAAVEHPQVRFFNYSVNMSYSSISTYYARTYEAKFLLGALAAVMCESDRLGYIVDCPVYGRLASINAFALGARMINPRIRVYLQWSGLKEEHSRENLEKLGISYIMGDNMITPNRPSREFGLYHKLPDGTVENLATQLCDWGAFYRRMVELILRGAADQKNRRGRQAINYWWGMSADVVDVIWSTELPTYTRRLVRFIRNSIRSGAFHVYDGEFIAQGGQVIGREGTMLTPEQIVKMDWLAENVVGTIPPTESFREEARRMLEVQGVLKEREGKEEQAHEDPAAGRS